MGSRVVRFTQLVLLWLGAGFFAIFAFGHQLGHPNSLAVIGLMSAALLLAPPTRAIISRYFSLSAGRTAVAVLLTFGFAAVAIHSDTDAAAIAKGWSSDADLQRATNLGIATPAKLAAYDERRKQQQAAKVRLAAEAREAVIERDRQLQATNARLAAKERKAAEAREAGWRADNERSAKMLAARSAAPWRNTYAPDRPSVNIRAKCNGEWPNDYTMQKFCIDQQENARAWARGQGIANGVARHCAGNWSNDWTMFKYCVNQQRKARNALGG
ncbi:MAG: hypothetical protein ACI9XZ_004745 [Alphaproteobacteria bacterium]|jgi:hypothetical protein